MNNGHTPSSLRVESALRLIPDVDVLTPLRALVIATSRMTAPDGTQLTVGKRSVQPDRLHQLVHEAVARFSEHLASVYGLMIKALAAESNGATGVAVQALLEASGYEIEQGRELAAQAWAEHALHLAESAPNRRAEIDALLVLAELELQRGAVERAARRAQRALAIADAARADNVSAAACLLLGRAASVRDVTQGALAWFALGLERAQGDAVLTARLELATGEILARRGARNAATEHLLSAERAFRSLNDFTNIAQALTARARIAAAAQQDDEALVLFREALALVQGRSRAASGARAELSVRLRLCRFLLQRKRLIDAEDEARRAEELAIIHNHSRELAHVYLVLGKIRGAQRDETGMVFFEKAIELSRGAVPALHLEADAYAEYARFCRALGQLDDAIAYAERERELRALEASAR